MTTEIDTREEFFVAILYSSLTLTTEYSPKTINSCDLLYVVNLTFYQSISKIFAF